MGGVCYLDCPFVGHADYAWGHCDTKNAPSSCVMSIVNILNWRGNLDSTQIGMDAGFDLYQRSVAIVDRIVLLEQETF